MTDIERLLRETAEEEAQAVAAVDDKLTLAEAAAQVHREEQRDATREPPQVSVRDEDDDGYGSGSFEAGSPNPGPEDRDDSAESSSDESSPELSDADVQLQICCFRGNTSGAEKLLSKGSNIAALSRSDQHGWTPLHWCASKGHIATTKLILEHAASKLKRLLNAQDGVVGWTPLHVSASPLSFFS